MKSIKNPAASVRDRLLTRSRESGDNFQRILTRYAIERLLFRISQTDAAERYVLKGAMLFVTWPTHVFRPTGDLDLLGHGDPDHKAITKLFTRICAVECPDDGVRFDPTSLQVEVAREAEAYPGIRLRATAELASARIPVLVDIGFGDHIYPPPKRQNFPGLLADLPQVNILMYPPETVIAEKFEAIIRFGEANGRIKDFYDIWVIARTFPLELSSLVEAVAGTLQRRGTSFPVEMPLGLTGAMTPIVEDRGLWTGFLRRNPPALEPPTFAEVQQELRRFLDPVVATLHTPEGAAGRWDPVSGSWQG